MVLRHWLCLTCERFCRFHYLKSQYTRRRHVGKNKTWNECHVLFLMEKELLSHMKNISRLRIEIKIKTVDNLSELLLIRLSNASSSL